jgi:16S rRNA (guanine966-N2)-methyltransferase
MRITGGTFRSRPLRAPKGDRTRPTSDRVREALFSILSANRGSFAKARVLDLYAGTGSLALEALSRGATHATLVENGPEALAALRANIKSLEVEAETMVLASPLERAARLLRGPFDLVFADPPYALVRSGEFARAVAPVLASGILAPSATVVVEHDSKDPPPALASLKCVESRRYGDTTLSFYEASEGFDAHY